MPVFNVDANISLGPELILVWLWNLARRFRPTVSNFIPNTNSFLLPKYIMLLWITRVKQFKIVKIQLLLSKYCNHY